MANILVVDDEQGIRDLLHDILDDEGHAVMVAENAEQARQYRLRAQPDLVLLDIWMPDTDGVSLLKEWSCNGQLTMPVVMMSGHATIETAIAATKLGALSFLEKPITLQKLMTTVNLGLKHVGKPHNPTARLSSPPSSPSPPVRLHSLATAHALSTNEELPTSETCDGDSPLREADLLPQPHYLIHLDQPLRCAKDEFDKAYFNYHLRTQNGSVSKVAEKTGLERTHLYRKLKQLGFDLTKVR